MATIRELAQTRPYQHSGGRGSSSRTFHVSDVVDGVDEVLTLFGSGDLPARGDLFPSSQVLMFAKDFSITPDGDNFGKFIVEWQYITPRGADGSTVAPGEVGFVDISSRATAEFVDGWRAFDPRGLEVRINAVAPSGFPLQSVCGAGGADIAGVHIDAVGQPMSVLRYTQTLQVVEVVDVRPSMSLLRAARGCRNRTQFGGAPTGSVLYSGFSIASVAGGKWQVTHEFVEATDFHLVQFACKTSLNEPILDANMTAASVLWRQPFLGIFNFYELSRNFVGVI